MHARTILFSIAGYPIKSLLSLIFAQFSRHHQTLRRRTTFGNPFVYLTFSSNWGFSSLPCLCASPLHSPNENKRYLCNDKVVYACSSAARIKKYSHLIPLPPRFSPTHLMLNSISTDWGFGVRESFRVLFYIYLILEMGG